MTFTHKNLKLLEIYTKSYASKRRILLLDFVATAQSLTVEDLATKSGLDYQTTAHHLQKLERTGCILKKYNGLSVEHTITRRGLLVLKHLHALLKI